MKDNYRIITNGEKFRVQKKWLFFWITEKWYSAWDNESNPYEFNTPEEAQQFAVRQAEEDRRAALRKKWKPI